MFLGSLTCLIDLHLHLDGAVSPAIARKLAALEGLSLPDEDELTDKIRVSKNCSSLIDFLEKFAFPCSLLQTREALTLCASSLLRELKDQGLMYAEIRFAPQKHCEKGLSQDDVVKAVLEGFKKVDGIESNLILCCMREKDNQKENIETLRVAEKYLNRGVCALDLAGDEVHFPMENFAPLFSLAREKRIPFTLHAGEALGADNVRAALALGATRIGHGVRSLEDEKLIETLKNLQLPLEVCPTSNLLTGVFSSLRPIKKLLDAGLFVTINTDDPAIEGTTLKEEFNAITTSCSLTQEAIGNLLENAARASFATAEQKERFLATIRSQLAS